MMRTRITHIELSSEDRERLRFMAGSGISEQRMARRARVILATSEGKPLELVAAQSGLSKNNCAKWKQRFVKQGIEGLADRSGRGRPKTIAQERRIQVVNLACGKPEDGGSHWSVRKIARATGLSVGAVHRILHAGDVKPHKVEYGCGKSPDPEFEEKQGAIIGLYMNPPSNALVLCVDEKSRIQALDRTQPELPILPGRPRRLTASDRRNGTTCLLAALAVHEGTVEGRCVDSTKHENFLGFLKHLYRAHPGRHLHIIADNLSAHKDKEVLEWVARRRRLTLHFTPTHASWLNQIEIWFNIFARAVLKGGIWKSKAELVAQIMKYIKHYNENQARPFRWTYEGIPLTA